MDIKKDDLIVSYPPEEDEPVHLNSVANDDDYKKIKELAKKFGGTIKSVNG